MSRVGARTLLAWHRTKPCKLITSIGKWFRYKYADNLVVALFKDCYIINYKPNDYNTIELTQTLQSIELLYIKFQSDRLRICYGTNNYTHTPIADALLQIPITDIFTMFPIVVGIIQKATKNYTVNLLHI